MKDASEDEGDDDDFIMVDDTKAEAARKARKEREERLRALMDEDDEMEDAPPDSVDEVQQETETELDASAPIDVQPKKLKEEEKDEEVKVEGGRRRGRRKVMKKKTVKDEDGFLVTTEEPAWESFSEEEPEPKKARLQQHTAVPKGKKSVKHGQGNIMNFFKKG
jgi:DNA polymerase delta subunit 3